MTNRVIICQVITLLVHLLHYWTFFLAFRATFYYIISQFGQLSHYQSIIILLYYYYTRLFLLPKRTDKQKQIISQKP
uniref:Very-long-chain 3-oxoacyl-CoA synthase n=1 Tax=Anguilla anguilla TaxID=7936 RepID=A0A0E9U610_ANGAN